MTDISSGSPSATSARDGDVKAAVAAHLAQSASYQVLRRTLFAEELSEQLPADDSPPRAAASQTSNDTATATTASNGTVPPDAPAPSESVPLREVDLGWLEQRQAASLSVSWRAEPEPEPAPQDPLVLDLDGNGFATTGIDGGRRFDLNGDGQRQQVSWITGGDAFLALDRNGNGSIDSGRELFGDQHGAAHGFAELAKFDDNGDGAIDGNDAVFDQLQLWTASGELLRLREAGVSRIGLGQHQVDVALNQYDRLAQLGQYERDDGSSGAAADLLLASRV